MHYLKQEDYQAHQILLCIQTQTTLDDPKRLKLKTNEFYFKSPEEMKQIFKEVPLALTNTVQIAQRCNLELDFTKTYLPEYSLSKEGISKKQFLYSLCQEGLKKKFSQPSSMEVKERLEHELQVINNSGYADYFLIVWDFIRFAKQQNIPVGPGRGSCAGSLASYLLGITDINPLKYNLLFERFLNPDRISLPDIDIDFCYERRGEVIDYVIHKYGKENVAQIITFGTMLARQVLRDVARVMDFSYTDSDRIAKLIPSELNITLESALKKVPELKSLYTTDEKVKELMDTSSTLEGLTRHASVHAAGVVISRKPLTEYVPLFKTTEGQVTTGHPMNSLKKIGLLKMDFLGLKTLSVIDETCKIIRRTRQIEVKIGNIPMDDKKTYKLLSEGKSSGVFQLESSGMRELLVKIKPNKFEDIIALLALYRPGPLGSGMIDEFIDRKHKRIPIVYDDERLKSILENTYGVILFQEQVMQIASQIAGFTLSQADILRQAMSKKTPEVMEEVREEFVQQAIKKGTKPKIAKKIFNLIEYFSGYGFNRSHSTAYAMISYRTSFLKANFPTEYMTALLSSEKDNTEKIVSYINEANRMNINILPPDVNESYAKFTLIRDNSIRFGLSAIKNVGLQAIGQIVKARDKFGKFKSLYEFCERVDLRVVNKKVIESLIKCGSFDSLRIYRSVLMTIIEDAINIGNNLQKDRSSGQLSFFDTTAELEGFKHSRRKIPDIKEWPKGQLLSFEKELLGFYITGHPLLKYKKILQMYSQTSTTQLYKFKDGQKVRLGGIIDKVKRTTTKKDNSRMAILSLEDFEGKIEAVVFPEAFKNSETFIRQSSIVFLEGRVSYRNSRPNVIVKEIIPIEQVASKLTQSLTIYLKSTPANETFDLNKLYELLSKYPGKTPIYLKLDDTDGEKTILELGRDFNISCNHELLEEIEKITSPDSIRAQVT